MNQSISASQSTSLESSRRIGEVIGTLLTLCSIIVTVLFAVYSSPTVVLADIEHQKAAARIDAGWDTLLFGVDVPPRLAEARSVAASVLLQAKENVIDRHDLRGRELFFEDRLQKYFAGVREIDCGDDGEEKIRSYRQCHLQLLQIIRDSDVTDDVLDRALMQLSYSYERIALAIQSVNPVSVQIPGLLQLALSTSQSLQTRFASEPSRRQDLVGAELCVLVHLGQVEEALTRLKREGLNSPTDTTLDYGAIRVLEASIRKNVENARDLVHELQNNWLSSQCSRVRGLDRARALVIIGEWHMRQEEVAAAKAAFTRAQIALDLQHHHIDSKDYQAVKRAVNRNLDAIARK